MQEFTSVTASSYDADALTPMLNEKSAEGWEVVSIVSAGSNIVAYFQRTAEEGSARPDAGASTDDVVAATEETVGDAVPVAEAALITEAVPSIPGDAAAEPTVPAVEEPAGWAVAPEATPDAPAEPSAPEPAVAEPISEAAADVPAQEPAPVESAVPAGWYADPSSRFELRYWDGTAWTEHVSRGGQQFTDPPVA
jgi:hypothetical protein